MLLIVLIAPLPFLDLAIVIALTGGAELERLNVTVTSGHRRIEPICDQQTPFD